MRNVLASLVCIAFLFAGCQLPAAAPAATSAPAEETGATVEVTGTPEVGTTEEMTGTATAGATEEMTETEELSPTEEITSTEGITADPVEVVKAFYNALNAKEYEKAVTFLTDDAVMINPTGTYTGTEANLAWIKAAWDAGLRIENSSLVNVDGIVVYHVIVTQNGTLLDEVDNGITIVEDGKIIFDGSTSDMPQAEDPTTPIEVVKAFYVALNAKEYDKAMTFLADDAVMINPGGIYTGTEANLAWIKASGEAGIRLGLSSLVNVDGVVVYHVIVTQNGTLLDEVDNGITIVEDGIITFDGSTSDMPQAEDPTAPIEVVKAFYIALNAKEYDKAMTLVADDATLTDDAGSHQGVAEITTRIIEAGGNGRSYDIWDISEEDGTVSYNVRVYQDNTVIYETTGSDVVEEGKITMSSTAEQ